ncbi:MAG: ATP-binding protein [Myxococcota bacterium]|nr:ATP-binding protein [Myxococcota bacterium]
MDRHQQLVARNPAAAAHAPHANDPVDCFAEGGRDGFRAALDEALTTREARSFDWGETGAAGVRRWYSTSVAPIELDGEVIGAVACSRDVTEMKRHEERLRRSEQLMVDTQGVAHLGTWEWDVTQPTVVWSDELYRIYGLTRGTYTPSYEAYLTKVHVDDRQRVIDATERVFHEHVPYSHDERIYRPDGSMRYLHTWAHPVRDEAGKLLRLVGVCQDITEQMEAQEAVRRSNAELEQRVSERTQQLQTALRDLETFNSMVSHDLRGPLAVIQMAVDMIEQQGDLPEQVPALLGRVRKAIDNTSELITDLLAFARVGHGSLQSVDVDATALCSDIVSEHRHAATERQVEVLVQPALRLHVDPTLFRAALSNLIGNAWKYTARASSPRIEIGAVRRSEGRALFIRDNGIGFHMKERDLLFRPFTRLGNATGFKGTGIGLATVERVVQRHGGSVHAEGAIGEGATFFLLLPDARWR